MPELRRRLLPYTRRCRHVRGSKVAAYDVSNPAAPTQTPVSPFDSGLRDNTSFGNPADRLTAIGALSLSGTYLLLGEYGGPSIVLMDITTGGPPPGSTNYVSPYLGGGILAIALFGPRAVACGPSGFDTLD